MSRKADLDIVIKYHETLPSIIYSNVKRKCLYYNIKSQRPNYSQEDILKDNNSAAPFTNMD